MRVLKALFYGIIYFFFLLTDLVFLFLVWFIMAVSIDIPEPTDTSILNTERKVLSPEFYTLNNSWLKKSESGLWEMYVEGNGFERGVTEGKLNKELAEKQEIAFVNQLRKMIPSEGMLNYLKFFIAFFNRNLDQHVTDEYKEEIYGESLFASDDFDFIAPKYYRMLNYHAAHDIGHAIQDKNMLVGCTSFGVWKSKSERGSLMIGRNFDFYVGDEFAENKIINFVKPEQGFRFMMVSWAGMIGTVSGMNEKGLTVTINASKSEIPTSAATPISLLAREILQYATNIEEAFAIAKKRKTFVSESILIGSHSDGRAATIEKTPSKTILFESPADDHIVCSNHYQDLQFKEDPVNMENIAKSSSGYRLQHLTELIQEKDSIDFKEAAAILRNQNGLDEKNIGMGNEKSLNQLIAHHSVIFKPGKLQVWISTSPYQLGEYICYDLNKVFALASGLKEKKELYEKELTIPADPFLYSKEFEKFKAYKEMREALNFAHKEELKYDIPDEMISKFIQCNPEYFETHFLAGRYYSDKGDNIMAFDHFVKALDKEITTQQDKKMIEDTLDELLRITIVEPKVVE